MRLLLPILALGLFLAAPAQAGPSGREITLYGGYNLGGSIDVREEMVTELNTLSSVSAGLGLTVYSRSTFALELAWNWRPTQLEGPSEEPGMRRKEITNLNMHEFHGNFTFFPQRRDQDLTPYFLVGLGFTVIAPEEFGDIKPDTITKFSFALGGGVRKYVSNRIGFRGQVRYHPTYISDQHGGTWCDPYYGCYQTVDTNWLDEWDFQAGLIVRL